MQKVKTIIHCGDIHAFVGKNFHVHEYVFSQLYKDIEKVKPDICVITGDIIDSKLRLSPEQIELVRNLFLNLSSYCPLIIIPGNHDSSLTNKDRLDSLSPILYSVYAECKNPIHFLKHSGVYNLYGIDWAVWSCFDDQKNPLKYEYENGVASFPKSPGHPLIGLYHGVVNGCISDNGMILQGGIDIEEFKECDTVLLSDIHQQQFFRNKEIGYSGSLLQTKINESIEGSYLIWNWEEKKKKFIPTVKRLKNIYSVISFEVDDIIDKNLKEIKDENQTVILKYDPSKISKTDILTYKKELSSIYKNKIEIKPIVKKKKVAIENEILSKEKLEQLKKISLNESFDLYIEKYKDILGISEIDKKILKELDEKYSKNLDISRDFELGDFSSLKIILNNFLSFPAEDKIIYLDKEGIYGILGENKVGKSSLLHAIKFALFNSTPHSSTVLKQLINKHNRNKSCNVNLFLSKNGKNYFIKRKLIPKKDSVSVELEFYESDIDGNVVKDLKGEKRQDTEKEIQKIFGTESVFEILSSFSAQKKQIEFIDCKNAERLSLVNKFLGLQSYEDKEKEVANDLKNKKVVYQAFMKDFNQNINLTDLENELINAINSLKDSKAILIDKEISLSSFLRQNENLLKQWNKTKVISEKKVPSAKDIQDQIKIIDKEIIGFTTYLEQKHEEIRNIENDISYFKINFSKLSDKDIKSWQPNYKVNKEIENELAINTSEIKKLKKQLEIDICTNCGKEYTESDKLKCERQIIQLENRNEVIKIELFDKEKELKSLLDLQTNYNNSGRLLSTTQGEIIESNSFIASKNSIKDKLQFQSDEYEEVEEAKKLLIILQTNVDKYNFTKNSIEKEIISLNVDIKGNENKIQNIEKEITIYKNKVKNLQELEEEMRVLKIYKDVIHKDGLPLYILKHKIDSINEQVNLIINQVFDFDIKFSIDEEAGDLNIDFIYPEDIEANNIGLASGSETFIINISIKIGLAQISELPKIDSLIIDEGYGTLDPKTVSKIPQLFSAINQYYRNVISISHLDELKEMVDHQIKLEKVGKYTEII